jgi:hypothetical protein
MRKWMLLSIVLVLAGTGVALTACGGEKSKAHGSEEGLVPVSLVQATEVPTPGSEFEPLTPGLIMRKGLTMLSQSEGTHNGTYYFYGEVRNDTTQYLTQVETYIYPLDYFGYQLDTIPASPLVTDIPPGQTFYVGRDFTPPPGYVSTQRWVWFDTSTAQPHFKGYFNLPTTVTFKGTDPKAVYVVRGTATNNTGKTLAFPVVDVVLTKSGGAPVGLTHAVVKTSMPNGLWSPGEVATYEATFRFVAVDPPWITGVKVSATGYTIN